MIPPRPAVIAHGKVLRPEDNRVKSCGYPARLFVSSARLRRRAYRSNLELSLICAWREYRKDHALRRQDKELPFPYCYEF